MRWLILINATIKECLYQTVPSVLGREGPGSCFTATGLPSISVLYSKLYTCQLQMDESLSDTFGYSECSGKSCCNVSCDMPGSCKSLVYTRYFPNLTSQHLRASDIQSEPAATVIYVNNVQKISREWQAALQGQVLGMEMSRSGYGATRYQEKIWTVWTFIRFLPFTFSVYLLEL